MIYIQEQPILFSEKTFRLLQILQAISDARLDVKVHNLYNLRRLHDERAHHM